MHPHQKHTIEKLGKEGTDAIANGYEPEASWHLWAYESTPERRALLSPHHETMHQAGKAMERIESRYSDIPLSDGDTVHIAAHAIALTVYKEAEERVAALEKRFALEHIRAFVASPPPPPAPTRTITVTADSSVMLRHTFEVPADATDEEIESLCEDLDGGQFVEVANSGDWSQTWE